MRQVKPLGLFGKMARQSRFSEDAEAIKALSGHIAAHERARIAQYLRAAPVIIALTGYTEDVIGGKFSVTGGSAIHSDGTYYWRRDTAEYVETYGTQLPPEFMEHGTKKGWRTPSLTSEEIMEIDDFFMDLRRRQGSADGCRPGTT
ncbi:hypothetical protein [Streptomyces sp. MUM 16J]|uniref:hypothetical protein n=1 Tax=Streptomyces sp. MUM 16J TaxID=2791988 RepID=UPI001F03CAA1|nr:hypothetical protein [Streptomyces sp. MUM 16J]MCH0561410.1 hypothetical protein [Streptomyces sp. MUM 16J]